MDEHVPVLDVLFDEGESGGEKHADVFFGVIFKNNPQMLNTYGQLQFIAAYRKYGLEFLPLHLLAILAEYDIRNCQPPDRMTCLSLGLYYPIHIIYWLDICHFTLFIFFIVLIHFCNSITIIKIKSLSHYEQKP